MGCASVVLAGFWLLNGWLIVGLIVGGWRLTGYRLAPEDSRLIDAWLMVASQLQSVCRWLTVGA
jgi:hypothetical protein